MFTSTFGTLVFICLTLYLKSVELHSLGSKESGSKDNGKRCIDSCQCPNGTACLPDGRGKGRKICQECGCRLISQCIKPSNEVLCDCSDPLYTGMYCETKISPELCPAGWFNNRSSCYYYVNTPTDWFSANPECQLLNSNAYLVEITDEEENAVVYTLGDYSFFLPSQ